MDGENWQDREKERYVHSKPKLDSTSSLWPRFPLRNVPLFPAFEFSSSFSLHPLTALRHDPLPTCLEPLSQISVPVSPSRFNLYQFPSILLSPIIFRENDTIHDLLAETSLHGFSKYLDLEYAERPLKGQRTVRLLVRPKAVLSVHRFFLTGKLDVIKILKRLR